MSEAVVMSQKVVVTKPLVQQAVVTKQVAQQVVSGGAQGPKGERGPVGPSGSSAFERTSASSISALRVVWEDADGNVATLDYRDGDHIYLLSGLTITATSGAGQSITVQRTGPLNAEGLGLTPGPVWLGVDGTLTQTPPDDGYDVLVGYATAEQRIFLVFDSSIDLEN